MNDQDIRWQQRFHQFEKAFLLLESTINIESLSVIERAGLIQFFEMSFELAWKLLKDFGESEGFSIKSPREAIKQAFQMGLIQKAHDWMDALEDRNLTVHTYNSEIALAVEEKIRKKYFSFLQQFCMHFKNKTSS